MHTTPSARTALLSSDHLEIEALIAKTAAALSRQPMSLSHQTWSLQTTGGNLVREELGFSVAIMLVSLMLQRLAYPLNDLPFNIAGPIGLLMAAYLVWRGVLVLDQRRVVAFLVIAAAGCLGALLSISVADARFAVISWPSLIQFLLLSSFAVFAFREAVSETRFFGAVNGCLIFIAVAGIFQFLLQFAGIIVFQWSALGLPIQYTQELVYNALIPSGLSGLYKSNGLFLAEPSIFSQFSALGLIIELLYFTRVTYLLIYFTALVVSVSGTGWLVFGTFVIAAVVRLGTRGVVLALSAIIGAGLSFGALAFLLPEVAQFFFDRIDEFNSPGSSGHLRFITPWWLLSDVFKEAPWSLLVGAGAGVSERMQTQVPYLYGINSPLKILIEFGFPALVAYFALFFAADRTPRQSALVAPAMTLFLFGGTYVQFAPILFPILLILAVARLQPSDD